MQANSSSVTQSYKVVGWVNEPNGRGTSSIIISCLVTLGLCVWSALHLNIPAKHESRLIFWLRNIRWVIIGILTPELVVLVAWRQWTSAKGLGKELKDVFEKEEHGLSVGNQDGNIAQSQPQRHPWTVVHSHYAGMGGFAFEVDANRFPLQSSNAQHKIRFTLTAHGVLLLARCGHLPDIDLDELRDKSNSDALAKAITLLQALWMVVQCLGRLVFNLPVSLLEVNTLGHVLCLFVIYVMWWDKPREVFEPTILRGEWAERLCAYMFMSSRISGNHEHGQFADWKPRSWKKQELADYIYVQPTSPQASNANNASKASEYTSVQTLARVHFAMDEHDSQSASSRPSTPGRGYLQYRLQHQDTIRTAEAKRRFFQFKKLNGKDSAVLRASRNTRVECRDPENSWARAAGGRAHDEKLRSSPLEQIMRESALNPTDYRHTLTVEAIESYPAIKERFSRESGIANSNSANSNAYKPKLEQLVVETASNWPSDHLKGRMNGQLMGMCLWLASIAYGGVHIAAWHEYFPSHEEQFLWRFSAVYIACSGAFWLILNVIAFFWPWAKDWFREYRQMKTNWVATVFCALGATICGATYIFARLFLVIDAIISLRRVPIEVYQTPNWSNLFPHL